MVTADLSDSALIQAAMAGSVHAFQDLMVRYERLVYKVALGYSRDQEQALDVVQNVFLKAYENLSSLRTEGSFKPWLMRITYHESVNWIRKQRRHSGHEQVDENAPIPSKDSSQEEQLLGRESADFLFRSLRCLNPRQRMVVTLKYYESLSIREIAGVLECSEAMVKNILFRSLEKLRRSLSAKGKVFHGAMS
jgi:RNA polymerase sigma-70 factor (ECF subfamily)